MQTPVPTISHGSSRWLEVLPLFGVPRTVHALLIVSRLCISEQCQRMPSLKIELIEMIEPIELSPNE